MAESENAPIKKQLGVLIKPKNVLRTIGSQIPFVSAGVEMMSQLEGAEVDGQINAIQEDVAALKKLQEAERSVPAEKPPDNNEWPVAVGEFMERSVELAVVYFRPERPNSEFVAPVPHGCVIGNGYVLTSSEAGNSAKEFAAERRGGRVIIMHGMAWYDFSVEEEQEKNGSGLMLCKLTKRDEEKWAETLEVFKDIALPGYLDPPPKAHVKSTLQPWLGQEVGWLVASEARNIMRGPEFSGQPGHDCASEPPGP